jgi:hypothetical protein
MRDIKEQEKCSGLEKGHIMFYKSGRRWQAMNGISNGKVLSYLLWE